MDQSQSLKLCKEFLGKKVKIQIDQPFGSTYEGTVYTLNYRFVPGTTAPDGKELDAYYLDLQEPVKEIEGFCTAIVHRLEDDDDKLVLVQEGRQYSDEQIEQLVHFREQYFKHVIVR